MHQTSELPGVLRATPYGRAVHRPSLSVAKRLRLQATYLAWLGTEFRLLLT